MLGCWWWRLEASGLLLLLFSLLAESWGVTTPIFYILFCDTLEIFRKFFFFDIQVPPKFPPKFRQSLPYTGRSQVIDIYPVYTSNISHLLITQLRPNRPGSQPNLLSSTQHILFNNII